MTTQPSLRTQHPYYMYDMMTAQPNAVARVLSEESDAIAELAEFMPIDAVAISLNTEITITSAFAHFLKSVNIAHSP